METKSILITKSISNKKVNEDYITIFKNENLNIQGIILADGIGSHYKPEVGAKFTVETLKELLENCNSPEELNIKLFFQQVQEKLNSELNAEKIPENTNDLFGTTLLCAMETEDKFILAYVGNGSIWNIKPLFVKLLHKRRFFPWCATNYLIPHTIEENGRSALYKFFAKNREPEEVSPTLLSIDKDKSGGDIIIISSDGFFSQDNLTIAKDPNSNLWIGGYSKIEKLLITMKEFITNAPISQENLEKCLNEYENIIKNEIDDDTTIGILFSPEAVKFHKTLWQEQLK